MSSAKRILRAERTRRLLCWLIALWIRLVYRTSRWQTVGGEIPRPFWDEGKPFILAFWHGRLMMAPMAWRRGASMNMLISAHNDGRIIADAIEHFGLGTITGSKSKGGMAALRAMLRALGAGQNVRLLHPTDRAARPWRRQPRHHRRRPADRGTDPATELCHDQAAAAGQLGPLPRGAALLARRLHLGRADPDRARRRCRRPGSGPPVARGTAERAHRRGRSPRRPRVPVEPAP